jgi:predicted transcriptional regulator
LAANELPVSVQHLIRRYFSSASDVDALLLLRRDGRGWTASGLARELRVNVDQAAGTLARLQRSGLLCTTGDTYRFDPRDPALAGAAAALAQLYPAYRMAVISLIYGRPTGAISDFS